MTIKYDKQTDTLTVHLSDTAKVFESDEQSPDVIVDFDKDGNIVGFEILRASQRIGDPLTIKYADVTPIALPAAA